MKKINYRPTVFNKVCSLMVLCFMGISLSNLAAQVSLNGKIRYPGKLKYVLGDVKQAQIHNKISNTSQINNLLNAFEEMGCNGVRINIFADGMNPNPQRFDEFYRAAKKRGFHIFANPAEFAGGMRIANGNKASLTKVGPPLRNNKSAAKILINRIKEFSKAYPCKWINPFNEDGGWSPSQVDTIYKSLHKKLNGAELIGPGAREIPPSIRVLQNTKIAKYISIATTHNLEFEHDRWDDFKKLADSLKLEIWDSEATDRLPKGRTVTRLDSALKTDVDGLVIYSAWTMVNLGNGTLRKSGNQVKSKISQSFVPDPKKTYYIHSPAHNLRLGLNSHSNKLFATSNIKTGSQVEWRFIDKGNGSWHIQSVTGNRNLGLRERSKGTPEMMSASSVKTNSYFDFTKADNGHHFITLPDQSDSMNRLQITDEGIVQFTSDQTTDASVSFEIIEVEANN